MRIIGQYKGANIRMTSMYMSQTYGGYLSMSKRWHEDRHRNMIDVNIPEEITHLYGKDRPYCIAGLDKVDYKQEFPPVKVIAWLSCCELIEDSTAHGSHLVMVWFQQRDDDPFVKAVANLKEISWEDNAKDFEC